MVLPEFQAARESRNEDSGADLRRGVPLSSRRRAAASAGRMATSQPDDREQWREVALEEEKRASALRCQRSAGVSAMWLQRDGLG